MACDCRSLKKTFSVTRHSQRYDQQIAATRQHSHSWLTQSKTYECPICFDSVDVHNALVLVSERIRMVWCVHSHRIQEPCKHVACLRCLPQHIISQINSGKASRIKCPAICEQQMSHQDITLALRNEPRELARYRAVAITSAYTHCTRTCGQLERFFVE